jgi:hypothetical protein
MMHLVTIEALVSRYQGEYMGIPPKDNGIPTCKESDRYVTLKEITYLTAILEH